MVVFLHGAGSLKPDVYRPWLRHLASQGDAVIFPLFEVDTGSPLALRDLITAVRAARVRLDSPFVPSVVIGYSRGGRLAVDYAALAPGVEQTPSAVLSVFPPLLLPSVEPVIDLGSIDPRTRIWILVGDRDQAVGREGARELLRRLNQGNFPPANVRAILVTSKRGFPASHLSPLRTSAAAKRAFWDRADRLIEQVVKSS
jgi:dienelactone hydrolase